jgi:hypothetical protein
VNTQILKDMIAVIRIEQERRSAKLENEDPNLAYDQWLFTDGPFLNELCLMFLVTLRHQIERELVGLAALADEGDKEISNEQYQENIKQLQIKREGKIKYWNWKKIEKKLKLESCEKYKFIKSLRLLSNSYKHDLSLKPDERLLDLLSLETGVKYAPLLESDAFRAGLADFLGMEKDSDYCDIAEQFMDIVSAFLVEVENRIRLSKVKWRAISLDPDDSAR